MDTEKINVLLVHDSPDATGRMLSDIKGVEFAVACGLDDIEQKLKDGQVDVLLIDMSMQNGAGPDGLIKIRAAAPYTALILIAGTDDEAEDIRAAYGGARDYLVRGKFDKDLLARAIKYAADRSRIEGALRESEMKLDSILDGIGEGVTIIDKDFRIQMVNKGYCNQVMMGCEDILGKYCYEVSHHSKVPCYETEHGCPAKSALETGTGQKLTHTHFRRDGKPFHVEIVSYPVRDRSGDIVSAIEISRDITETIALENDLKKRIGELEEFYDMAVGRELKMVELKEEIENLRRELNVARK